MTMKFYMTPGSCSTGIHILLEEIGLLFEAYPVNLLAGEQNQPDYLAINARGTIPSLVRDDGVAMTDFQSIAWWLARRYPECKLLPDTIDGEIQVLELMNLAVNFIHGEGFARIFTTDKFSANDNEQERIKQQGRKFVDQGFGIAEQRLSSPDYNPELFDIADAALFYVEFWANHLEIMLPAHCQAHYGRALQRPSVRQVLAEEGYSSIYR